MNTGGNAGGASDNHVSADCGYNSVSYCKDNEPTSVSNDVLTNNNACSRYCGILAGAPDRSSFMNFSFGGV